MLQLTVKTLTGEEQQFIDIDETSTVSAFNAVVATRTGSPVEAFRMYRGVTYLAKGKTFQDVGVADGTKLTMQKRQDNKQRAQIRINALGVRPKFGGVARSIKYDIRAGTEDVINDMRAGTEDVLDGIAGVDQKQAEMAAEIKLIKNVMMGEATPRHAGQSDKERMKHLRSLKHFANNELVDIRENEDNRQAAGKRTAANQLREMAEIADGCVQLAVGEGVSSRADVVAKKAQLTQDYKLSLKLLAARDKQFVKNELAITKLLSQPASPVGKATGSVASTDGEGHGKSVGDATGSVASTKGKGRGKSVGYAGSKRPRR